MISTKPHKSALGLQRNMNSDFGFEQVESENEHSSILTLIWLVKEARTFYFKHLVLTVRGKKHQDIAGATLTSQS